MLSAITVLVILSYVAVGSKLVIPVGGSLVGCGMMHLDALRSISLMGRVRVVIRPAVLRSVDSLDK